MRRLWQGIVRTVFWSYERGSWPYDLLVAAIVLFVFLSPRSWFNDHAQIAQAGPSPHPAPAQFHQVDPVTGAKVYRVDFQSVVSPPGFPELERRAHDALRRDVEGLKGRTFQILRIVPVRGEDSTVLYYDVWVKP
jgi:hypothetical protein